MEINGNQIQKIIREYIKDVEASNTGTQKKSGSARTSEDKIELSHNREDIERAKKKIENLPGKREAEIRKIKSEIEEGTYNPPPKQVAEKLASHYIIDTLV